MDAHALAARLDLRLDRTPVCGACLSFVSMPLGAGKLEEARREARRISRDLWAEGLEAPLRAGLERARASGDAEADEALREVDVAGGKARIVVAVIERLAQEQHRRTRAALARGESPWPVLGFQEYRGGSSLGGDR